MINSSGSELHEIIVGKYEDYEVEEVFFALGSGEESYTLPSNFFKGLAVDKYYMDGYRELSRWKLEERNTMYQGNQIPKYKFHNNKVKFVPAGSASGIYRMWYIPTFTKATSMSDEFDIMQSWEEYIVVDVCIKIMTKLETEADVFIMQKQQLLDRIAKHAANRDAGNQIVVRDWAEGEYDSDIPRRW
jgi:hypothetical protein